MESKESPSSQPFTPPSSCGQDSPLALNSRLMSEEPWSSLLELEACLQKFNITILRMETSQSMLKQSLTDEKLGLILRLRSLMQTMTNLTPIHKFLFTSSVSRLVSERVSQLDPTSSDF